MGLPSEQAKTEFYQHDANWSNRMILGDSLQVMASLAEREGLRGKVQMIYIDPPYGIKFNSNFQWSTTSRDIKDGKKDHITREPEQVKAFRDTWRDGIHSYLAYLRDRLEVARDLLTDSGSCFVQIGDKNVHRVRALMDEVFVEDNFISQISFRTKTMPLGPNFLEQMHNFIIWYAKDKKNHTKYRQLFREMDYSPNSGFPFFVDEAGYISKVLKGDNSWEEKGKIAGSKSLEPVGSNLDRKFNPVFEGTQYSYPKNGYATDEIGMNRLRKASRLIASGKLIRYLLAAQDKSHSDLTVPWNDTVGAGDKTYVVQTATKIIQRCLLMTTDPGDLVLDPTCGSGTAAYVAEQWGRRWITMDTSRVALALARARLMGARYPYYLLADSPEGQQKESEITQSLPKESATYGDIRQGFVYSRVPYITLKSIANNAEIDVIYENHQKKLEQIRAELNKALKQNKLHFARGFSGSIYLR